MKKIYITLSPTDFQQTITIFEDNKASTTEKIALSQLKTKIAAIPDIDEIVFVGNKQYTKKFEEELKKTEKTKYGLSKIKYSQVER